MELFSPVHNSSVGEVVLAATSADGIELLAVVQEDAAADGRLYLGSPDGLPLSLLELPYSLNPDQKSSASANRSQKAFTKEAHHSGMPADRQKRPSDTDRHIKE